MLINARGSATIDTTAAESAAQQIRDGMREVKGVASVTEPQWSPDHTALLLSAQLAKDQDDPAGLQKVTDRVQAANPTLQVREAGDLTIDQGINDRVGEDLSSAEGISLPVTLILMLLAFGALIAAGIPVLLAATSVAATIGLIAPLSHLVHAEGTVSSMIVLIGMAVGVDYSLFYLKREREERAAGRSTLDAVEIAAQTSGHSILVSGGAVIASMAGLFVMDDATFNSLATGAIMVVAVAVLGSITVLPALLVKLGRWVDRPRVPLLWRLNRRIGRGGISTRILGPVVRRPVVALVISGAAVILLALPALGHEDPLGQPRDPARGHPAGADLPAAHRGVPGRGDHGLAGGPSAGLGPGGRRRCADVAGPRGGEDLLVRGVGPRPGPGLRGRHHVGARARHPVRGVRPQGGPRDRVPADRPRAGRAEGSGRDVRRGRRRRGVARLRRATRTPRLPIVIGVVLLLTMLMMAFAFRSVPIALISTALNLASVGVAFGILTLVFQHGWGAGALDFTSPGFVISWIPLFVMVVLVGPVDGLPRVRAQQGP